MSAIENFPMSHSYANLLSTFGWLFCIYSLYGYLKCFFLLLYLILLLHKTISKAQIYALVPQRMSHIFRSKLKIKGNHQEMFESCNLFKQFQKIIYGSFLHTVTFKTSVVILLGT